MLTFSRHRRFWRCPARSILAKSNAWMVTVININTIYYIILYINIQSQSITEYHRISQNITEYTSKYLWNLVNTHHINVMYIPYKSYCSGQPGAVEFQPWSLEKASTCNGWWVCSSLFTTNDKQRQRNANPSLLQIRYVGIYSSWSEDQCWYLSSMHHFSGDKSLRPSLHERWRPGGSCWIKKDE